LGTVVFTCKNRGRKCRATVPLESSQEQKTPGAKIIYNFKLLYTKNLPKIAEVKLSSCGLQKKLQVQNCGVAVAEQYSLKSCGIAIAEVLPSSCGVAIADFKKSCACPPLLKCQLNRRTLILKFK
jgi:hypothetical protein